MDKGITPLVSMILLVLIVIAFVSAFMMFIMRGNQTMTSTGSENIKTAINTSTKTLFIEDVTNDGTKLYLRNLGASDVNPSEISLYVDDELWKINESLSDILQPGKVGIISLQNSIPNGEHEIKLSCGGSRDGVKKKITNSARNPPCDSYGDLNSDNFVKEDDSVLLVNYYMKGWNSVKDDTILTQLEFERRADVNNDGSITLFDASMIGRYANKLINTFPVCP